MTQCKPKWILVLENGRSPLSGEDNSCVVGPFDSEEQARVYANSDACDADGFLGMRAMQLLRPADPKSEERLQISAALERSLIAKSAWEAMALPYYRKQIVQRLRARPLSNKPQ